MDLDAIIKKLPEAKLLVVGDVMLDHYIWGDATRISPEAPVPVVHVFNDTWQAGGAANVALNLTSLQVSTTIMGVCADDDAGTKLKEIFTDRKVGYSGLQTAANAPTILKTRVVVQKQQICRIDREAAPVAYALQTGDALRSVCDGVNAVIVSDYAKGVVTGDLLTELTAICADQKCLLAVDPKPRRRLDYKGADLMTPNRSEALELAEISIGLHDEFPAKAVCQAIWERYQPHRLVVTLGGDGMLLAEEGKILGRLPTRAQEVFDVSGAGDTVIAVLTAALAVGASLLDAAHLANAAAGVVVGKFGAATVSPDQLGNACRDSHLPLIDSSPALKQI
ncbi:bifunctional heptose 7-phosphate kinase/heptose 1-phosphate adenyltransferase [Cerasicoccus arenae]|uniref:ADP-heptose synthase n=1 Tax=Cerasicoccus arenae TaxID=424488 RepID=A0A8J3DCD2_9BACT|nr:PfkB family carbohydrate kinase [Cerasicoccus arenae]MBK1858631.1 bifunctional hydroxymethylpyrimidine kinase/phosphomethylpyrimidine kinase [Cerasicoccus arenae]GHC04885.1 ADP-heptose synthase [Cerasicoccus arenae]